MTKERTETAYSDGTSSIETLTVTRTNDKARSQQYAYADSTTDFTSSGNTLTIYANATFLYDPDKSVSCTSKSHTASYTGVDNISIENSYTESSYHLLDVKFPVEVQKSFVWYTYASWIRCDTFGNVQSGKVW